MLKNYFITAWRNMLRNKANSFINLSGLTIGIACALFIAIFIQNEWSYDKFHKNADRIFQVILNGNINGQEFWAGNTPPPVGFALTQAIPEIETYTRLYKPNDVVVRNEENGTIKTFTEKNVLAVDSNFLQVFDFGILEGNGNTALMKNGSVVITENIAKKYFGNIKAIGQTLLIGQNNKPFVVTAVTRNVPPQSSIQFDILTPVADYPVIKQFSWSWVWQQMICYVKLKNNISTDAANIRAIESKFPAVVRVQAASAFKRIGNPFDEFIKNGGKWNFHLMPFTDVHLRSSKVSIPWISHISNIKYIYIFGSIALFIIFLACVNFMNLSTARAANRGKEVGIRKVAGSTRAQLVRQFLSESFLYSIISSIFAVVLVTLLLKPFSVIIDEPVSFQSAFTPNICFALIGLTLIVGLLAGIYPALYLISFKPVLVLKGNHSFSSWGKTLLLRNSLVVFQFVISTIMIIGTLVVLKQLKFFRDTDLGFNKENVIVISGSNRLGKSEESFRQTVIQIPGVINAGITTGIPSGSYFGDSYQPQPESVNTTKELNLFSYMVSDDFIPTLGIKLLEGRNFSKDFNDSASVILNEEAVKQIGWKHPIGKWLDYPGGNMTRFKVVGVVKNFNVESLRSEMSAFALFHTSSKTYDLGNSDIVVKIKPDNPAATLTQIKNKWKEFSSSEPYDFNFLDAQVDSQYRTEQRFGSIFGLFAALSIFIACLGLFGLCTYVVERRKKEIGIRKVLGATVESVVSLISKDFLKLTILAVIIAFPIAWWIMTKWLEDFAYRIHIEWTVFIMAALYIGVITLFSISYQAIKAGLNNPAKNLKSE